jgi:DNA-binding CsgD family transcriptional regulator
VLVSRPSPTEARLSFAGLGDLVGGMPVAALGALPSPQRAALEIALLLRPPAASPPDQRAIALAFLTGVTAAAERAPVIVAVDDVQWLDIPTASVLEFVARRLDGARVGFLCSVRVEDERPLTFERSISENNRTDIEVGPLSLAALHTLLKRRTGHVVPRPTLVRVERASRGNPLHALEIARELLASGGHHDNALPVPDDLRKLIRARLRRLPPATRHALLVAAALSEPTTADLDEAALEPALVADVVRIGVGDRVLFTHPLFASAVYEATTPSRRRALHRELAERVEEAEEHARHLALAQTGPDEDVAAALDAASAQAHGRGAIEIAIELKREARRLTPPSLESAARRRTVELGDLLFTAGDTPAARTLLEVLVAECPPGTQRADALALLGMVRWYDGGWDEGIALCEQALTETNGSGQKARVHSQLAWMCSERIPDAAEHARAAVALLSEEADPGLYSEALLSRCEWELKAGLGADNEAAERGICLQAAASGREQSYVPVTWPRYNDDFETSRARAESRLETARVEQDEVVICEQLMHFGWLAWLTGDLDHAESHLAEAREISARSGNVLFDASLDLITANVAAQRGRLDEARAAVDRVRALLDSYPSPLFEARCYEAAGFLCLSTRDPQGADRAYTRADELIAATGMREPVDYRFQGDHVEVVLELGELGRAGELVERLAARTRVFPRPWTLAIAARSRALLEAARGDLAAAESSLLDARAYHERLDMPFELARTLLCLGRVQRRRNERKAARETLCQAVDVFERIDSELWAQRAREERDRIGVRRAPTELTVSEERVAALAASGLTNREIAGKLFMSRRTVEANLARAYRKLGIRSRAELGAVMATRTPV